MASEHDDWIERVFGVRMPARSDRVAAKAVSDGAVMGAAATSGLAAGVLAAASATLAAGGTRRAPTAPVPRAGVGPAQVKRALGLLARMPPADQARVKAAYNAAKAEEQPYLAKALASGHTAAEVLAFHARIAGKPHAWMENNLHLVGNTRGKGIKQQWANSCAPTIVEAMRGELDPIYALRLNEQNPNLTRADDKDGMRLNPGLAAAQKRELAASGSVAVNRGDSTSHGDGEDDATMMKHLAAATGLEFQFKSAGWPEKFSYKLQELRSPSNLRRTLDDMRSSIRAGFPVPLGVVTFASARDLNLPIKDAPDVVWPLGGHALLCTGYDPGPPPRYSIHDPDSGSTVVVTEDELRNGNFHVGRPGRTFLQGIYQPVSGK